MLQALMIELNTAAQDSAPKYFLDENKIISGLCIDIMKAIENVDKNIRFTGYNRFVPFKRIKKMLKNGEMDIFFGFVKNKSRLKDYIFLDEPLYKVNHVIAVLREDNVIINNFDDIRKLGNDGKILTTFGTSTGRFLEKQGGLKIDDSGKTILANLKMLIRKRGRFVYYHNLGLVTTIKKENLENKIIILPSSFREYSQYIVFSKNVSKEVIQNIKKALLKVKNNGTLDKIYLKYSTILSK